VLARLPFLRSPGRAAVAVFLVVLAPWAIIACRPAAAPNVSVPTATVSPQLSPTAPAGGYTIRVALDERGCGDPPSQATTSCDYTWVE